MFRPLPRGILGSDNANRRLLDGLLSVCTDAGSLALFHPNRPYILLIISLARRAQGPERLCSDKPFVHLCALLSSTNRWICASSLNVSLEQATYRFRGENGIFHDPMLLQELKSETQALHERIEQVIDFPSRLGTLDVYAGLLARFHGFYLPLESKLAASLGTAVVGLDWETRRKAHLLVQDLISLGWSQPEINALPRCSALPEISSVDRAFGCLYVLEGATLGGQIIQKAVSLQLGLGPQGGCSFFSGYGTQTGEMWKRFCETLTTFGETHPDARKVVVDAAVMTFRSLTTWVTKEKAW